MSAADTLLDSRRRSGITARRLLVAWQHPTSRAFDIVGCLDLPVEPDQPYRFAYFDRAKSVADFQPFVGMPDLQTVYESADLFPLFENRLTPRRRADYPDVAASVGLGADADPFEVLARTGGRRATDTVEVFGEPFVDPAGWFAMPFLVRGLRHIDGVEPIVDQLQTGAKLRLLWDVQNPMDTLALTVGDDQTRTLGWVPRYLAPPIHRAAHQFGWSAISVSVEHIGDPFGPPHLRLLCQLGVRWDPREPVFTGPDFSLPDGQVVAKELHTGEGLTESS